MMMMMIMIMIMTTLRNNSINKNGAMKNMKMIEMTAASFVTAIAIFVCLTELTG
jgi:hypothetical protein